MVQSSKLVGTAGVLALIAACCSSGDQEEGSSSEGSQSSGDGGTLVDSDANSTYSGGTRPLDDGGIEALRDESCAGWSASPEPLPSVLMLVVDVSGSMNREDPTDPSQTKWQVTQPALMEAISALPAATALGMLFYPNMATSESTVERDSTDCVVTEAMIPIDLLGGADSAHRDQLESSLASTRPNDRAGTPTHDAYVAALEELERTDFAGNKYMLIITDGQPTFLLHCLGTGRTSDPVDEQPIVDEIASARTRDIRTFLIGSPGSEENVSTGDDARPWLSEAAESGGTAKDGCSHDGRPEYCHFDMTEEADFGQGLRGALADIAGQIVQCDYGLPAPPPGEELNPDQVNIVFTPGDGVPLLVLRSSDPDCTEGWRYSEDGERVVLCEDTCNQVQSDPLAQLEVLFGCATEVAPVY